MNRYLAILVFFFTAYSLSAQKKERPENLIIFIGDGMGVAQVYATMTASGFEMTFPKFPVTGLSITHSANSYTTDSAAGGTALATGEKTNNRMIAMRPDSSLLTTILELAKAKGMSTGVICTSSLTDATPATFTGHAALRSNYFDIAANYLNGAADIFIGGGRNFFLERNDSLDLKTELEKKGYDVVLTLEDFVSSSSGRIAGLMSDGDMPYISAGRDPEYLSDATAKAIRVLSENPKGFILMVEGSEVDDGGHNNDLKMTIEEILDMDRAVKIAYDFARKEKNTLIVVTADHETGGLALNGGDIANRAVKGVFGTTGHSGVMVPVFAFGPGALSFTGVQQNTELFHDFVDLLSLKKK